jgi:small subunit ribosomal protein S6
LVEFSAPGTLVADFELMIKRDERVLRFLTVKMDEHHAAYSVKRKVRLGYKKAEA